MTVVRRMLGVVVVALATTACGGGGGGAPDGPAVDAFPTAPHTPYPQVPDLGGPRLAHPQLITVTFANDPRAAAFEAYAQWLVGSSWLTTVGADYGVGAGNVAGVAHRPETPLATLTSADIETYLADGITDGSIPRPAAPATLADALYIVYYPSTTSITTTFVNGIMKSSCVDFGGYHGEVHHAGLDFAYSAIPDCGGNLQGLTADETTEMIVSHEVIEAATDAAPISAPAWQLRPGQADPWFRVFEFEVEVGDLCEAPSRYTREAGHVAQRSWSNSAAAAGGEPCVPIDPALPAFGVTVTPAGTQQIARGASLDFTLTGWATGEVPDWRMTTQIPTNTGTFSTLTKVGFGTPMINNGRTTTVTVTIPAGAAAGSHASIFLFSSHNTGDATMWPLAIDVQ